MSSTPSGRRADLSASRLDLVGSQVGSHRRSIALSDRLAVAALLAFTLVFYRQLTLGGRVLATFDTLAYFYPLLTYLGESLKVGRLPLWNPDHFVGAPFLANPQTGVFYPLNWLTAVVAAPVAYSWSVAIHALIAAIGAYVCGRRALRLGPLGALATAVVFAFGGFFTAQAVHLNQMAAAAWLPWLVLATDSLVRRPRLPVALGGAAVLALVILAGHSQIVYLCAWAVAIWGGSSLLAGLDAKRRAGADRREIARWLAPRLGALALLGGLGVALTAAQLLPTFELSREGIRASGLTFDEAASFSFPPWKSLVSLLPTLGRAGVFSEWVGYVGVCALTLAGFALVGVRDRRVLTLGLLVGVGLLFALGKYTPIYELFYRLVPGFDLFRVPARWLLLYSFGLAGLAGIGLDSLDIARRKAPSQSGHSADESLADSRQPVGGSVRTRTALTDVSIELDREHCTSLPPWRVLAARLGGLGAVVGAVLVAYHLTQRAFPLERAGTTVALVWLGLAAATFVACLVCVVRPRSATIARPLLLAFIVGELLVSSLWLDVNRVNLPEAVLDAPAEVRYLQAQSQDQPEAQSETQKGLHRVLGISETAYEVGDVDAVRARLAGTLTPDEVYDYLVALKHKETLTPNLSLVFGLSSLDGYDGGVLPLRSYLDVKSLFPTEGTNVADGRLRLQLRRIPDSRLLGWLNVRFVVQDRAADLWQDGHYYDLAFRREVVGGRPVALTGLGPVASGFGLVATVDGATPAAGEVVGTARFADAAGRIVELPLRLGIEVAAGGQAARATRLDLPAGFAPTELTLEYRLASGRLTLRALTALGATNDSDRIIGLSPDYRLVHLGDTKVYELRDVTPRAYFAGGVRLVADGAGARELLSMPSFDPSREAVVSAREWPGAAPDSGFARGKAEVAAWQPERIVVRTTSSGPGMLVVTDAAYPGWRARVDGFETPIILTDLAFRGVPVTAGEHVVEMWFEPRSLRLGAAISAIALASALVILCGSALRRSKR